MCFFPFFFGFQCLSAKQVGEKELSAAQAITPLSHLMKGLVMSLRLRCCDWQQFNSQRSWMTQSFFFTSQSYNDPVLLEHCSVIIALIRACDEFTEVTVGEQPSPEVWLTHVGHVLRMCVYLAPGPGAESSESRSAVSCGALSVYSTVT